MRSNTCILLLAVFIILVVSCAPRMQRRMDRKGRGEAQKIEGQIESLVQKGDYAGAVELIGNVDQKYVAEIQCSASYIAALNGLADSGMQYFKEGDFTRAGMTFKCVVEHMSPDSSTNGKYTKTPENIRSLLIICEDRLMKQGLSQYRSGNLGDAIATWKDVLKLNPNHPEAKKALKTATVQLKNLEKIESN